MALQNNKQKRCCVLGCQSNIVVKNCKLFKFPTDFDSCQKWKFALKLIGTISENHCVCASHFCNDDFVGGSRGKKQLKKGVVPSQNLPREHTYMKFGNPNRSKVTKVTKVVKKPSDGDKIVKVVQKPHTASSTSISINITNPSPNSTVRKTPTSTLQYAYLHNGSAFDIHPWSSDSTSMVGTTPMSPQQDPLALGTNKTPLDPLAFRYIPALTDTPNTKDTRQAIQKPKTTSKQGPKTSTRLTLVQRILDDAIQKVDTALFIKDNHVAFGVNEKLGLTSETTEKITIQTQNNAKVMELLVVKNNPIINKQVDEAFKDIDQAIDKALNKLNAHDLKSSSYPSYCRGTQTTTDAIEEENQRLKSEIRSLKWELQKKKAVLTTPTKTTKKLVYWVKEPGSSAIKTPTKTVCKKTVTLSSKKPGMSPRKTPVPAVVKKFTLPLITSVTSLSTAEMDDVEKTADAVDACVEDKLSNDHTNTTTDSTNKANDIVDLTD